MGHVYEDKRSGWGGGVGGVGSRGMAKVDAGGRMGAEKEGTRGAEVEEELA